MLDQKKIEEQKRIDANLKRFKNSIVVISGKGGVGKSTVSVNLAFGLAEKGKKVGILDVDIHGPSMGKMLGIEGKPLEVENGIPKPVRVSENVYAVTIASMMPKNDDPIIWRGPLKIGAIKQFIGEIEWPEIDYLIVDSPPGTGDEPLTVMQTLKKP
ncbi:MAG: P-loop NTPase, partial [Candidatus Cloacimonadota bacterium]|nr:P-loop NTPase [Candidatus Cloacimonadota bacterium]